MLISPSVLLLVQLQKPADILQKDVPNYIQAKIFFSDQILHHFSRKKEILNYDLVIGLFADENAKHLSICI